MKSDIAGAFRMHRAIFIIRASTSAHLESMTETIWEGGGKFVEITLNTPGAIEALKSLSGRKPHSCHLGAGTVCCAEDVRRAADAGVDFAVSPVGSPELVAQVRECRLLGIIGASTPTEIYNAHTWGADFVKVFPAQSPEYIKSIRGPLRHIPLVAVGGVTKENAIKYINAGCVGVALGGSFFPAGRDGSCDSDELKAAVRAAVKVCQL